MKIDNDYIFKTLDEFIQKDVLKFDEFNNIYLNGIKLNEYSLSQLKDEALYLKNSRLLNVFKDNFKKKSLDILLKTCKNQEDINIARAFIVVITNLDNIIERVLNEKKEIEQSKYINIDKK